MVLDSRQFAGEEHPTLLDPAGGGGFSPSSVSDTAPASIGDSSSDPFGPCDDRLAGLVIGGKYRLVRRIGRGGMGSVYLACSCADEGRAPFAVKILDPLFVAPDKSILSRFRREAEILKTVRSDRIVRCHDAGYWEEPSGEGRKREFLYFVMDYVGDSDRADLRSSKTKSLAALFAERRLEAAELVGILRDIASALSATHEKGVVHRDVKPKNVMIGPDNRAVLVDFGIAKHFGDAVRETLTRTGHCVLSESHAAPEQFIPSGKVDRRADVYALGLIAYEGFCGRLPPQGRDSVSNAYLLRREDLPSRLGKNVGAETDRVVLKALHPDPAKRYGTVEDFLGRLERSLRIRSLEPLVWRSVCVLAGILAAALTLLWLSGALRKG